MELTREELLSIICVRQRGSSGYISLAELEKETGCKVAATDEQLMKIYTEIRAAMDLIDREILFGKSLPLNEEVLDEYCGEPKPPANPNPVYIPKHIQRREKWRK